MREWEPWSKAFGKVWGLVCLLWIATQFCFDLNTIIINILPLRNSIIRVAHKQIRQDCGKDTFLYFLHKNKQKQDIYQQRFEIIMFIIKQSRWLKVTKTHRILWKQGSRQRGDFPLSLSPQWWRTLLQFQTLSTPWLCSSTLRKERGGHYMRGEIFLHFAPVSS